MFTLNMYFLLFSLPRFLASFLASFLPSWCACGRSQASPPPQVKDKQYPRDRTHRPTHAHKRARGARCTNRETREEEEEEEEVEEEGEEE
jgi:uncharacterized MAPEG superfamily protein